MTYVTTSTQQEIQLADRIGSGHDAVIYAVADQPDAVAKIYHPQQRPPEQKLRVMLDNPPDDPMRAEGHVSIAWPTDLIRQKGRKILGYLMPRISNGVPIHALYNPSERRYDFPGATWRTLHRTARHLAHTFATVHAKGYVIGDVHETNILVQPDGLVSLIDTDLFQVPNPNGPLFRCISGKPEYLAPEIQGKDLSRITRTDDQDLFALAVLIYLLLMEGTHPFQGSGDPRNLADRIQRGLFSHSPLRNSAIPPVHSPRFETLHSDLRKLFYQCFVEGHAHPDRRPRATDWATGLQTADDALVACRKNSRHVFVNTQKACPWCERRENVKDPFPAIVQAPKPVKQQALPNFTASHSKHILRYVLGILLVGLVVSGVLFFEDGREILRQVMPAKTPVMPGKTPVMPAKTPVMPGKTPAPTPTVTATVAPTPTSVPTAQPTATPYDIQRLINSGGCSGIPSSECEVLVTLFTTTDGENWEDNTGWLTAESPCEWYGITCKDGHVAQIILGNNHLSGTIPPELGDFEKLTHLDLQSNELVGWNKLSGPIPPELGNLSQLTELNLNGNQLSGSIPPELGNLSQLTNLSLADSQLSGPIPLELTTLTKLAHLNLSWNSLTGHIPPEFGNLSQLKSLCLQVNQLSGPIPRELGNLQFLRSLCLNENHLSGPIPPELGNLGELTGLWLYSNQLSGLLPPELGNLTKLVHWELNNNQLHDPIPPEFGNLAALKTWSLSKNQFDGALPATLTKLTQLEHFFFVDTQLCEPADSTFQQWLNSLIWVEPTNRPCESSSATPVASPTPLPSPTPAPASSAFTTCDAVVGMPASECEALTALYDATDGDHWKTNTDWLTTNMPCDWHGITCENSHVVGLDLGNNNLNGTFPQELCHLVHLRSLWLPSNKLAGPIPPEISGLGQLAELNLVNNRLSGPIPSELGKLSNLNSLTLFVNQLSGRIPPELGELGNLKALSLSENQLDGTIPPELGKLRHLTWLKLNSNQLSGPVPPELGNLKKLVYVFLNHNQLSGRIPPELGNLENVAVFSLSENQFEGPLPRTFIRLTDLEDFSFIDTQLCEPSDADFQKWLNSIEKVRRSGLRCQ